MIYTTFIQGYRDMWYTPLSYRDTGICDLHHYNTGIQGYVIYTTLIQGYRDMWYTPLSYRDTGICDIHHFHTGIQGYVIYTTFILGWIHYEMDALSNFFAIPLYFNSDSGSQCFVFVQKFIFHNPFSLAFMPMLIYSSNLRYSFF